MTYKGKRTWYIEYLVGMLPFFADLLKSNGIKFWLDWGTLLGAVRDGRAIPWDFDIDLGIMHDDAGRVMALSPRIIKEGYEITWITKDRFIKKIQFYGDKGQAFHIDLDTWVVDGDVARAVFGMSNTHNLDDLKQLAEIKFEGRLYPCPKNPEEVVERFFGKDWRTPKISCGNMIFVKRYDPENTDIVEEIKKHPMFVSAWDRAMGYEQRDNRIYQRIL